MNGHSLSNRRNCQIKPHGGALKVTSCKRLQIDKPLFYQHRFYIKECEWFWFILVGEVYARRVRLPQGWPRSGDRTGWIILFSHEGSIIIETSEESSIKNRALMRTKESCTI